MSAVATPRSATSIAFIVAGVAVILPVLFAIASIGFDTRWLTYGALTVAFALLARTELKNGTARAAALFIALGWLILLVFVFLPGMGGIVASSAYFVIVAASIVTGVVVITARELRPRSRQALVAVLAITVLYMASAFLVSFFSGPIAALLTILLGVAAVITGYFLQTRR